MVKHEAEINENGCNFPPSLLVPEAKPHMKTLNAHIATHTFTYI